MLTTVLVFYSDSLQNHLSQLDHLVLKRWDDARNAGVFNYSVEKVVTKILSGKYGIVAQVCIFSTGKLTNWF